MANVDVVMTDDFSFSSGSSFVPNGLLTEDPFVSNGLLLDNVIAPGTPAPIYQTQGAILRTT